MSTSPEIQAFIDRLERELSETERTAREGIDMIRPIVYDFPDNIVLTRFFASLSNNLLYVEISRRRIQITMNRISSVDVSADQIIEAVEDLGLELGRAIEAKIGVKRIVDRLRELP